MVKECWEHVDWFHIDETAEIIMPVLNDLALEGLVYKSTEEHPPPKHGKIQVFIHEQVLAGLLIRFIKLIYVFRHSQHTGGKQ